MAHRRRFYVVWEGHAPGIYDSWDECRLQTENYPGARFKAFDSQDDATEAFRNGSAEQDAIVRAIARKQPVQLYNYQAFPDLNLDAIAVDGACSRNPGPMEYQGVDILTGQLLFHFGPIDNGTNNIAEYLAIIHALALLDKTKNAHTVVYSDSRTALSWVNHRGHRSCISRTPATARIHDLLDRADRWIKAHPNHNPILKWNTDAWGEIPADFDRK